MGCECLKEMVGTRRLELLTSTVSKFPVAVQLTTYRSLGTAWQHRKLRRSGAFAGDFAGVIRLRLLAMKVMLLVLDSNLRPPA